MEEGKTEGVEECMVSARKQEGVNYKQALVKRWQFGEKQLSRWPGKPSAWQEIVS